MVECDYCGEEFESERELHLHWGEQHGDEITSHEKEKVKRANRKNDEEKEKRVRKRKRLAGWGLAAALAVIFVAVAGPPLANSVMSGGSTSFELEGQPMLGEENASVTVVAFEDYKCPHCGRFESQVFPKLKQDYLDTGKAKFYFINFPVLGAESQAAAVASECVYRQDEQAFWDYKSTLFDNQATLAATTDNLVELARQNTEGLDYSGLRQCISDAETAGEVDSDLNLGQQNGVTGTPTIFVNGQQVQDWSYPNLESVIEGELGAD